MMNRRQALATMTLSTTALLAHRWNAAAQAPAAAAAPAGFQLPPLAYAPEALEPHIDAQTMLIHHGKHHAAYVANLNKALQPHPDLQAKTLEELIGNLDTLPEGIRTTVRNNGGGHANHALFWKCLSPQGGAAPQGELGEQINATFGSLAALQEAMNKAGLGQFGSGWAWLSLDADQRLLVEALPNQDSPLMFGRQPLFGVDVWEHAYYLRYQNRRGDYLKAIWNVVDWQYVAARYVELAAV